MDRNQHGLYTGRQLLAVGCSWYLVTTHRCHQIFTICHCWEAQGKVKVRIKRFTFKDVIEVFHFIYTRANMV